MAKKKQNDNIEIFKNLSNKENIVANAEMRKENTKKKTQEKIKEVKERETSNKTEEVIATENNIEKAEVAIPTVETIETPKDETINDVVEVKFEIGKIETPNVETINEIVETSSDIVETINEVVEVKYEIGKQDNYSIKRMLGYDWMGVVYED